MPRQIASFTGEYRFLSNFFPCKVTVDWDGEAHQVGSVEHAFQASKATRREDFDRICQAVSPGMAKRAGKEVFIRRDWEEVKFQVMEDLLRQKFSDPELRKQLVGTGNAELVEGNDWGDVVWGSCRGKGENHLGRLLMKIRKDFL